MEQSPRKGKLLWLRALCVVLAFGALAYVFSKINLAELAQAFRSARAGWFVATIAVYGMVLLPSAWRWHLALQLTKCAVSAWATLRMTLIGHLFYTLFFGVAGGDAAKSVMYSRWYNKPLPEVLASAPLDRLLGFGGLVIFMAASFGLAAANRAFSSFGSTSLKMPIGWIALALVLAVLIWIALKRLNKESAVGRALRAFIDGIKRLVKSWHVLGEGIFCAVLVQAALAMSLAFGLEAVSHSPVPWGRLAWTFPVISVASALPVNIAGMGLREGAVLTLLGLYGISPADAVAASLLTFLARAFWAIVGGAALVHRQRHHWEWWPRKSARRSVEV